MLSLVIVHKPERSFPPHPFRMNDVNRDSFRIVVRYFTCKLNIFGMRVRKEILSADEVKGTEV